MTSVPAFSSLRTIAFMAMTLAAVMVAASLGRQGPQSSPPVRIAFESAAFVSSAGGAETIEALFH